MIREGNVAVQAREEEIRFLKMQGQEEQRGINVLRKALPNKRNLEQELVTLQIQVTRRNCHTTFIITAQWLYVLLY